MNKVNEVIQAIIPLSLIILLVLSIIELFYNIENFFLITDLFDIFIIIIFSIDLYYKSKEHKSIYSFIKTNYLDIFATIPFNLIFYGLDFIVFTRTFRGLKLLSNFNKYTRFLRFTRFFTRLPRFLKFKGYLNKKIKDKKFQPHEKKFKVMLSFKVILLVTINSIMGTGIWFLTSSGAKHAGPASLISWMILSLIALYISMCFSELTSMFPKAGGVYEFAKQSYGRFWSFVIGWTTSISGSVTISMLLLGALQYMIPKTFSYLYVPIAVGLVIIFNFVAYKGMQTSTYMLVTFAIITIGTITAIIVPGLFSFEASNLKPFFVFPNISIFLAIFFIAETFFGWESAIFLASETKNPKKIMPKALIIGTIIIAIFAFLLSLTAMGSIHWQKYAQSVAPLKDLGRVYFGNIGSALFTILVSTSIIGAVASWIVSAPRLLMALAEDKLFFVQFARIHPKYKSPYVSIIFQIIVISVLVYIGSGSYETLLHILIPLILILYSSLLLSVVILRYKKPNAQRPFKVPFGKVGPIITILFMIFLLYMFIDQTHHSIEMLNISLSLILFGIPAYFTIEIFYDDKYIKIRRHIIAYMMHYLHLLPLTKRNYNQSINLLRPIKNDAIVMDFNSGTGRFTQRILKKEPSIKKVHSVLRINIEEKVFNNKLNPKYKQKVKTHFTKSFNLPKNVKVDIFFAHNTLGYVKNVKKFLEDLNLSLKRGAKFCFYIKKTLVNTTPNALIFEDLEKLRDLFLDAGFKMHYKKKKRLFKEQIYIYGVKR